MEFLQNYLNEWKWERAKAAHDATIARVLREMSATMELYKGNAITEKQFNSRIRQLQMEDAEAERVYRETEFWQPKVTDIPPIRYLLEAVAWIVIYSAIVFAARPAWTRNHWEDVLPVSVALSVAVTCLRNNWKRHDGKP